MGSDRTVRVYTVLLKLCCRCLLLLHLNLHLSKAQFLGGQLPPISALPSTLSAIPGVIKALPAAIPQNLPPLPRLETLPSVIQTFTEDNERFMPTLRTGLTTLDIIKKRGFIGEQYTIKSRDGCPLTVYHLINPLANPLTLNKYPAIVFHGLAADSSQMLSFSANVRPRAPVVGQINANPTDESLAFLLSNNNYDVWLLDARGANIDSRDPKQPHQFWDYSLDEQAQLDLPSMIDFVLKQTGSDKVIYVGYSESTFFMFALLSKQPEYQNKLAAYVAMAPVAYVGSASGAAIAGLSPYTLIPDQLNGDYIPQPLINSVQKGIGKFCSFRAYTSGLCNQLSQATVGVSTSSDIAPDFYTTQAKSTSVKAFKHFYQLYHQKRFGMYDYGPEQNMIMYGQRFPPNYRLGNIKLPTIILLRAGNDLLSDPEDQQILVDQLGAAVYLNLFIPEYNHVDFIIARDVVEKVNVPILRVVHRILTADGLTSPVRHLLTPMAKIQKPDAMVGPDVAKMAAPAQQARKSSLFIKSPLNLLDGLSMNQELNNVIPSFIGDGLSPIAAASSSSLPARSSAAASSSVSSDGSSANIFDTLLSPRLFSSNMMI